MQVFKILILVKVFISVFSSGTAANLERHTITYSNVTERIVADLASFEVGVQIDFSYNESLSEASTVISAPGCPRSLEGRPWVYYGSPPKCYLVGFRGPCKFGRRIFSVNNSKYGVCNCDCFAEVDRPTALNPVMLKLEPTADNEVLILPRNMERGRGMRQCNSTKGNEKRATDLKAKYVRDRYQFCFSPTLHRLVAYDGLRQECHAFLDQGPCMKGEWLVKSVEVKGGIECEKRKCPEFSTAQSEAQFGAGFTYFDYIKQECQTQAYGQFEDTFFANIGGITSDRKRYCQKAGMKYSHILKTCVKDLKTKFDFILG